VQDFLARIFLTLMTIWLWQGIAHAGENIRVPFVRYETNEKFVRTGGVWGWTTRFQNGAPEEHGKISDNGFLKAELFLPRGKGPFPVVVLMHGCGGMDAIAHKWASQWTAYLTALNIGTLVLDSFTTRGVRLTCGSPDAYWSRRRVDDAYSALDLLVARSEIKSNHIYVMGRSNGGRAVLNILQSDYRSMRTNMFAGGVSLYGHCEARREANFYSPLLLLTAEQDDANPAVFCRQLADHKRAADHPEIVFVSYAGAFHGFDDGSPIRKFNGWRMGGNAAAAADARRQVRQFLIRRGAIAQ